MAQPAVPRNSMLLQSPSDPGSQPQPQGQARRAESNISQPARHASPSPSEQTAIVPQALTNHGRYFIHDDMVVFLVDNTLFKVHRYFLQRESAVFRAMLDQGQYSGPHVGTLDDPIHLHDVSCNDLENLLDFLYKGMHDDHNITLEQWISILRISTLYDCPKVRIRAIREIGADKHRTALGPVDKIVLAQKYDVPNWLFACYEALCQRPHGLDDEEAEMLGPTTTNGIWRAREAIREDACAMQHSKNTSGPKIRFAASAFRSSNTEVTHSEWDGGAFNTLSVSRVVQQIFWPPEEPSPVRASRRLPSIPPRSLTPSPEPQFAPLAPAVRSTPQVGSVNLGSTPQAPMPIPLSPASIDSPLVPNHPHQQGHGQKLSGSIGRRLTKRRAKDNLAIIRSPEGDADTD